MTEAFGVGIEPRPSLDISHLVVLRREEVSLLCQPSGKFGTSTSSASGLYFRDMRYLSALDTRLQHERLVLLDSEEGGGVLTTTLTNAEVTDDPDVSVSPQTLLLRRRRTVGRTTVEGLTLVNHGRATFRGTLEVVFEADFKDMFVVRGFQRRSVPPEPTVRVTPRSVQYEYAGLDGELRTTHLDFQPTPSSLVEGTATFDVELAPGAAAELELTIAIAESWSGGTPGESSVRRSAMRLTGTAVRFESSNGQLNDLYQRAVEDLESLVVAGEEGTFLAAGIPWFDACFGRDSLITGIALLRICREAMPETLKVLARTQASMVAADRDAEPGKIAHELRVGELANIGEVPFGRYYGSVDSTPLFILACREYARWADDRATLDSVWSAIEKAVEWCVLQASKTPAGLLAYHRESSSGLEHQGWKDSWDGICHPDGSPVIPPVALVEVQAYYVAALRAYSELCRLVGKVPGDHEQSVSTVLQALKDDFCSDSVPALAIDGNGTPVRTATSNVGHVLWAGACSAEVSQRIADHLMSEAMFSGWGVRTLASGQPAFNPLGYHVGSVWPHDNAIILEGLRRFGHADAVEKLGTALLEAMLAFPDGRIPELFSGDARGLRRQPTPYPVASRPQAWAAASLPWILFTMLGVTAEDPTSLHVVRPTLPAWLDWVRLSEVKFGDTTVDLHFRRGQRTVGVEVERHDGPGRVVLSPEWPVPPIGE
ncbi:MAG: glycogen debranching N-terminal domain-containing protein [bacterium]